MPSSSAEVVVRPTKLPAKERLLERPALLRQIAGPVGRHAGQQFGRARRQRLLGIAQDQLGHAPRAGKGQVAHAVLHQGREQVRRLGVGAAPHAARLVHQGRVPQDKGAL